MSLLQIINFIFSFILFALFFSLLYVNYYWSKYWQNYKLQTNLKSIFSKLFYPYLKRIRKHKKSNFFLIYFISSIIIEYSFYFTILKISAAFIKKSPNLILVSFIVPLLILNIFASFLILFLNHFFQNLILEITVLSRYFVFKIKSLFIDFKLSLFLLKIIFFDSVINKDSFN